MSLDPQAKTITCELAPSVKQLEGGRYGFPPGYYNGALLTDESHTARYRVLSVDNKTRHPFPA